MSRTRDVVLLVLHPCGSPVNFRVAFASQREHHDKRRLFQAFEWYLYRGYWRVPGRVNVTQGRALQRCVVRAQVRTHLVSPSQRAMGNANCHDVDKSERQWVHTMHFPMYVVKALWFMSMVNLSG